MWSPEHLAQRPVEQVRRGVVAHGVGADAADFQDRLLADLEPALRDPADVQDAVAELLRVVHLEAAGGRGDQAGIADLAALLGIEVGLVQEQGGLLARRQAAGSDDRVVLDPADDRRLRRRARRTWGSRRSWAVRP